MRGYDYIGSAQFLPQGEFPPRVQLTGLDALRVWMHEHEGDLDMEECIPATFVIDPEARFWIADRATEHVACARLGRVLAAGEVFFSGMRGNPYIHRISNQSAGYCPEPESWDAVETALEALGIEHPVGFEPCCIFRRCPDCATVVIVKDAEYTCLVCGAALPPTWNIGPADEVSQSVRGRDKPPGKV